MEKNTFIVDGYSFDTEIQAEKARKELEGVRYIREKLDMDNPEAVLTVYNRILREKMFSTPVGYAYLRELQEYLYACPQIDNEYVHAIDFEPALQNARQNDAESIRLKKEKVRLNKKEEKERQRARRKEQAKDKDARSAARFKGMFITSLIFNFALVIAIIGMMVIMNMSDSPTIINYENKLIDKYESWQEELTDRENRIKEYEEEYGIENGY